MEEQLVDSIRDFVSESNYNRIDDPEFKYFDEPLVKFSTANDPLFQQYKKIIGSFHLTPREAFELEFGERCFHSGTVISIVLPISEFIRKSNRVQTEFASREWALLRSFGDENFISKLVKFTVEQLKQHGFRALAPGRSKSFKISSTESGATSNWSERHIAYVAGQGSFSLNDGFISEKGMAIRMISIVTDAIFAPNKRTVKFHNENCLFYSKGICGACIKRCPAGALTKGGHDKKRCYAFAYSEDGRQRAVAWGAQYDFGSGCGLCQTKVPCECKCP